MSFFDDLGLGAATPGTLTSLFDPGDLAGTDRAAKAKIASEQAESELSTANLSAQDQINLAADNSQGFLSPFAAASSQGVEQAGFLTDAQAQFDFLQNNPLFQLALDNANQSTMASSAATGRISAGDTLQDLSNNVLLSASPLIDSQKASITDMLNLGTGVATNQANITSGQGADIANLIQGGGNIAATGTQNLNQIQADTTAQQNQLGAQIFSMVSDPKLKSNRKKTGESNGYSTWSWDWNDIAGDVFGLFGSGYGVMADEVLSKTPNAVTMKDGYLAVNYSMIGVDHGGQ